MTQLFEQAHKVASGLPAPEQDALAGACLLNLTQKEDGITRSPSPRMYWQNSRQRRWMTAGRVGRRHLLRTSNQLVLETCLIAQTADLDGAQWIPVPSRRLFGIQSAHLSAFHFQPNQQEVLTNGNKDRLGLCR